MKPTLLLLTTLLLAPLPSPITAQTRWENSELIYEQPATFPHRGQPIGNGRMGTMVWTSTDAVHLQIKRRFGCDGRSQPQDEGQQSVRFVESGRVF